MVKFVLLTGKQVYRSHKLIHETEENDVILVCGTCKNIRMTLDCVRNTI